MLTIHHFLDSYLKNVQLTSKPCTPRTSDPWASPQKSVFKEYAKQLGLVICTEPLLFCYYFKSYPGHTDANFNIAILDGHKEFVAHEKFQQMLHKVSVFLEGYSFKISNFHKKDCSQSQKQQPKTSKVFFMSRGMIFWNDITIDILG